LAMPSGTQIAIGVTGLVFFLGIAVVLFIKRQKIKDCLGTDEQLQTEELAEVGAKDDEL